MPKLTRALVTAAAAAVVAVPVAQGEAMSPNPWKDTSIAKMQPWKDTSIAKMHPWKSGSVQHHVLHANRGVARMNPWKDPGNTR
jgi:photosystem II stability/assembly factor-like uncharacterized protein